MRDEAGLITSKSSRQDMTRKFDLQFLIMKLPFLFLQSSIR